MKIVPMYPDPYKLKIHLEHTDIYRIVLVPSFINMLQLHLVCQEAMGWMMAHLFTFTDKKGSTARIKAGLPIEDLPFLSGPKEIKADKVKLNEFHEITGGKSFWYWYDFGDDWWHKISFQKPTKKDLELYSGTPVCLDGKKACPPEDIGGVDGYLHFLKIINENTQPDKDELMDFYGFMEGDVFDPEFFEIDFINEELTEIMEWDEWNKTADDFI
ncbi:plasmid pRiA4b ORF-3 family protein [Marivirga salinae]|uniref:Plasmid pRiA4b ORF-3 family protein n=1 Tax=Marivirga salinarum TaxID=3059078 RepID=A0AA51RDC8_9BACT|nr:plasmid pRiA4b ORF-3 family protein [Marivirga sp. BDSF4-3]WMN12963.1 plasmid pRiA4b ORF-3 family protein [Marivirga sp. BDSF4-3]